MMQLFKTLLIFLLTTIVLFADRNSLFETVKAMPVLQNSASIVVDEDKTYLVGVGRSTIHGKDAMAKIRAIKEAQMLANKTIMSFSYGTNVEIEEDLKTTKTTTTLVIDGKVVNGNKKLEKKYLQRIRESGDGILVGLQELGKWMNNNKYYYAYYVLIPKVEE
jgi:hypothetical protein